jgi:hypothetical protein
LPRQRHPLVRQIEGDRVLPQEPGPEVGDRERGDDVDPRAGLGEPGDVEPAARAGLLILVNSYSYENV